MKISSLSGASTELAIESYRRGYRNPPYLRDFIASVHRTGVTASITIALIDQSLIVDLLIATSAVATGAGINLTDTAVTALACFVAVAVVARQLCGLENPSMTAISGTSSSGVISVTNRRCLVTAGGSLLAAQVHTIGMMHAGIQSTRPGSMRSSHVHDRICID